MAHRLVPIKNEKLVRVVTGRHRLVLHLEARGLATLDDRVWLVAWRECSAIGCVLVSEQCEVIYSNSLLSSRSIIRRRRWNMSKGMSLQQTKIYNSADVQADTGVIYPNLKQRNDREALVAQLEQLCSAVVMMTQVEMDFSCVIPRESNPRPPASL